MNRCFMPSEEVLFSTGIDPGMSGAYAVVRGLKGRPRLICAGPLPGDPHELFGLLERVCGRPDPTNPPVALERVPMFMGDKESMTTAQNGKLQRHAALIEGYLTGAGHGVKMYAPQSWQRRWRDVLPRKSSLETERQQTLWKTALWELANSLYPDKKINKQWADAVLIATHHHANIQLR